MKIVAQPSELVVPGVLLRRNITDPRVLELNKGVPPAILQRLALCSKHLFHFLLRVDPERLVTSWEPPQDYGAETDPEWEVERERLEGEESKE